jgi:hypothetical protein
MEQRLTPEVFYGSAIAALCGLLFGLLLHAGWQRHPGGPRILFSSAEAAELAHADADTPRTAQPDPVVLADDNCSYVPPDPLPVTRLAPQMFDVQPAAADEAERQSVDDVVADDAPQASPGEAD